MNIYIDAHGTPIDSGLISACGSEARWALSWAKLLGMMGHKVYIKCDLVNGDRNIVEYGIELDRKNPSRDILFDVALLGGEEGIQKEEARASKYFYLCCHHGSVKKPGFCQGGNQFLCYHTEGVWDNYQNGDFNLYRDKTFFLPTPLSEGFGQSKFSNQNAAYIIKFLLTDNVWEFRAMTKFIKNMGINIYMCHMLDMYKEIFNKEVYPIKDQSIILDRINRSEFAEIFNKSKIVFAFGQTGGTSCIEAAINGSVIGVSTATQFAIGERIDRLFYSNPYSKSEDEVIDNWTRLYKDKDFYEKVLSEYQRKLSPHIYKNAYSYFLKAVNGE